MNTQAVQDLYAENIPFIIDYLSDPEFDPYGDVVEPFSIDKKRFFKSHECDTLKNENCQVYTDEVSNIIEI